MALPIFGEIERLITEHGSAVILKEHLGLLNTKLGLLKEYVEKLEKENADLVGRNAYLEQQSARQKKSEEFVEAHGALFKRLPTGGYGETPCCPVCHKSMWCFQSVFPYECSDKSCGHKANFKGRDIEKIIANLPP